MPTMYIFSYEYKQQEGGIHLKPGLKPQNYSLPLINFEIFLVPIFNKLCISQKLLFFLAFNIFESNNCIFVQKYPHIKILKY